MSPFETTVYGADTTGNVSVADIFEASHAHKASKCLLIRESPDALYKVLVACLIVCHYPACVHTIAYLTSEALALWYRDVHKEYQLNQTPMQGTCAQSKYLPANLREHIEGVGIIQLLQARKCQLRELQAVKGSAPSQHLQPRASLSAPRIATGSAT